MSLLKDMLSLFRKIVAEEREPPKKTHFKRAYDDGGNWDDIERREWWIMDEDDNNWFVIEAFNDTYQRDWVWGEKFKPFRKDSWRFPTPEEEIELDKLNEQWGVF